MVKGNDVIAEGKTLTCGLVMPISAIDGCTTEHWVDVKNIICEAVASIEGVTFIPKLVSEQDDVGVIQKRIVQNIYTSDIVICDVSCKNANVMFELGMRLAFDKPTILIKDDKTDFSFDTGVIEHLLYPRDLRFSRIVGFKKALADKVYATYQASEADPLHSTFLKNFGSFKVAALNQTEGTADQVILDMLQDISRDVSRLKRNANLSQSKRVAGNLDSWAECQVAYQKFKNEFGYSGMPSDMIGLEQIYDYMEKHITLTPFSSRAEFVNFVDEFLSMLSKL